VAGGVAITRVDAVSPSPARNRPRREQREQGWPSSCLSVMGSSSCVCRLRVPPSPATFQRPCVRVRRVRARAGLGTTGLANYPWENLIEQASRLSRLLPDLVCGITRVYCRGHVLQLFRKLQNGSDMTAALGLLKPRQRQTGIARPRGPADLDATLRALRQTCPKTGPVASEVRILTTTPGPTGGRAVRTGSGGMPSGLVCSAVSHPI